MTRLSHPGYVSVFPQGGNDGTPITWFVDHADYHYDSAGILATFDNETAAHLYAKRWREAHPVPEGFDDE